MNSDQVAQATRLIETTISFVNSLTAEEFQHLCIRNKKFERLIDLCQELCETTQAAGY